MIIINSPNRNVFEAIPTDLLDYLSKDGLMGADPKTATPAWLVDHFSKPTPIDPSEVLKTYIIWASGGVVKDLGPVKSHLDLSRNVTEFKLQQKDDLVPQGWEICCRTRRLKLRIRQKRISHLFSRLM